MAVKNAAAKNWVITPSFDGYLYSAYPNGDKPSGYQTTPTLLGTDIVSGSRIGFENNKGCYLSLYGYSLGRAADLGTAAGARVYMRDGAGANTWVEVDNYRFLRISRVWAGLQVVEIGVQVGALGGKTGHLDIKITVNGVDTNIILAATRATTVNGVSANIISAGFYVQDGRCAYVSTSGNDATGMFDDITKPFRYLQNASGVVIVAGSLWDDTTTMGEQGVRPGDTIVLRSGTFTDNTGVSGRWFRPHDHSGVYPNGQAGSKQIRVTGTANNGSGLIRLTVASTTGFTTGESCGVFGVRGTVEANGQWTITVVNGTTIDLQGSTYANAYNGTFQGRITNYSGYIHVTSYPGAVLAHAPETAFYDGNTASAGGFHGTGSGAGSAKAGRYMSISNVRIASAAANADTAASPISLGYNYAVSGWRVVGCDTTWPSSVGSALSAGIEGGAQSGTYVGFNYVHEVYGSLATPQNHGIYYSTENSAAVFPANDNIIEYNYMVNCTGGSFVQFYSSAGVDMERNTIRHNVGVTSGKYGLNLNISFISGDVYNNVIIGTPLAGLQFNNGGASTFAINVSFNTFYNCAYSGNYSVISHDNAYTTGAINITHNISAFPAAHSNATGNYFGGSGSSTAITLDQNLYYDAKGVITSIPSKDSTNGIYGNPLFTAVATNDLTLATGSPALNAVTTTPAYAATVDVYGIARPQSTNKDIGACEGVGT